MTTAVSISYAVYIQLINKRSSWEITSDLKLGCNTVVCRQSLTECAIHKAHRLSWSRDIPLASHSHPLFPQPQCIQHETKCNSAMGQVCSQLFFQDSLFAEDLAKSCKELNKPYKKVLVENNGVPPCLVPRALPEGASGNPVLFQMDRAGLGPLWLTDKCK